MPTKRTQEFMDLKHGNDKKASKPLMEKRRRARINHSLAQLKNLVVDPNITERSRQAKLEKADILELTVRHLHEIKRRQRTVSLVDSGNPKMKFEMGYSECVREVDLFLTNLMDPKLCGIEPELQRRLNDHLSRRLQDLHNIEPLAENASTEDVFESLSADSLSNGSSTESLSSVSSSNPNSIAVSCSVESYPLTQTTINTYPVNKNKLRKPNEDHVIPYAAFSSPLEDYQNSSDKSCSLSLPSVQTTISPQRDRFTSSPSSEPNMVLENDSFQHNPAFFQSGKDLTLPSSSFEHLQLRDNNAQTYNESFRQQSEHDFTTNDSSNIRKVCEGEILELNKAPAACNPERLEDLYHKIPLAPRQLSNGEWALVLPRNLSLSEIKSQSPLSAFRLVWPSGCPEVEHEPHKMRQQYVSSPLSSSVSDMSCEDYCLRADGDASVKMEQGGLNEAVHFMWRPW